MQFSGRNFGQKRRGPAVALGIVLLFGSLSASYQPKASAFADSDTAMKETARKLAERIAGIPGLRGPWRLEWHPDEKWPAGEGARWLEMLRAEFDRRALPMDEEAGSAALAVYAQETPTEVVLSARAQVSDHEEVRIVEVARAALPPLETPVAAVRVERQLIYESADRILDAASLSNLAEGGLGVLLYKNFEVTALRVDLKGELKQSVPLNVAGLKPARDPRGEMAPRGAQVAVELWGKACEFSWDAPAEVKCRAEKASSPTKSNWRMDTVLTSPCDEANWTVSEGGNDPTSRDVLRLIPDGAIAGSSATVVSEFPGPVLNVNAGQNGSRALIVVRNLRTGNYEVYKITLVCGD